MNMRNAILFLVLLVGFFQSDQLLATDSPTEITKNKHDDRTYPNSDNSPTTYFFGIKLTLERSDATCANERDGWMKAIVSGGVGPYSYLWSNGATTATIEQLNIGHYTVTVTDDATGQTRSASALIKEPEQLVLNTNLRHISCSGTDDGRIDVSAEGGVGPFSYAWRIGGSGTVRQNLPAGRYFITVTDANGCTATATPKILASSIPTLYTEATPENCNGTGNDGKVRITISGDAPPYDIVWSTGDRQKETLSSLSPGDYTVTVTNARGCSTVETMQVNAGGDALEVELSANEFICGNAPIGAASVIVTGGQAPYTYTWSNGATGPSQNNLSPGNHSITIRDSNGCTKEIPFTIDSKPVPNIELHSNKKVCFGNADGGIQSTVTGGLAPYTYLWSNGSTDANLTNAPKGDYMLTVTDAAGCTSVADSKVRSTDEVFIAVTDFQEVTCPGGNDGRISVNVTGGTENGFTYAWSSGQVGTSITNLEAGTYTLSATDNFSNCVTTKVVTVPEPPAIDITGSSTPASNENTADGTASVSVSGGTPDYTYSWSNGATTSTISNLANGTYTVTVTDALACTKTTSILVEASCILKVNLFAAPSNCLGNEGNIVADAIDTNHDVTYQWSDGRTGRSIIGLAAGYYTVTATDAVGCTASAGVMVGDACSCSDPIINNIVVINASSAETADGSIKIEMASGSYNYQWSDPSINGGTATGLGAGTYTVTITDTKSTSCETIETIVISNSSLGPIDVVATTATECGKAIGTAMLAPANYAYTWSDGKSGHNRGDLAAGNYSITVTDPSRPGVQDVIQVSIETEGGLLVTPTINEFPTCGLNNGSVSLAVSGGSGDYSYGIWGTSNTRTDLMAGTYTIDIIDNRFGCTESFTFSLLNQGSNIEVAITNILQVSCAGGTDGQVQFTTSGNVAQTRIIDGLGMEYSPTALGAGDYCIEAIDTDGCLVGSECFEIIEPDLIYVTINRIPATCARGGSILLNVRGGNGAYQVNWNDLSDTTSELIRTDVPRGVYAFSLSDSKNCTASTSSIQIDQIAGPTLSISATGSTTNSSADGTAAVVANGGAAPYTYQWNNNGTTATINNIAAGTYTVTVTDANGCAEVNSVTVVANCLLNANISVNASAGCLGTEGSISANITGTTKALNYAWSNGATGQTIIGLSEGYYSVTATDAAGCVISTGIMVQNNCACSDPVIANVVVTKASAMDAKDGAIKIQMQSAGSYSYQWSDPTINGTNATGLLSGEYIVTITDAISPSCATIERILVGNSEIGFIKVVSTTNTECGKATGSATLDPANFSYAWSDGQGGHIRNDLAAGTYTITATDPANPGLEDFIQVTIESEGGLVVTPVFNTLPDCGLNNGAVSLSVTGGSGNYSYSLWGNTNSRTDLIAGTYTVQVTDNTFGCTELLTFALNNTGANIDVTITNILPVSCVGQADGQVQFTTSSNVAEVRVMDGFGNSYNANALPAGDYSLEAIDADGCLVGSELFEISSPDLLYVGVSRTQATCATGGTINLDVQGGNGGYQVNWNDLAGSTSELTRTNLPAGVYALTISDTRNCSAAVSSIQLDQKDGPIISATATAAMTNTSADGSATVSVSGGQSPYTYQWNNNGTTATINNIPAGTYTVTVTDANGCAEVTSVTVGATCLLQATIAVANVTCAGGNGQLTANISNANGALSYTWSNGSTGQTIANLKRGLYSVTATDALGCTISTSAFVASDCNCVEPEIISTVLIEATGPEEEDGVITLSLNGGNDSFNFQWSNGQNEASITGLNPGTYTVTISDKNDAECLLIRDILVGNSTTKVGPIEITSLTHSECGQNNGSAQLFPTGLDFSWSDGGTGFSRTNLAPGTYTVTATFESLFPGEADVITVVIESEGGLDATAMINQQPDCGSNNGSATIQATGGSGNYTFDWGSSFGPTRTDLIGGTYSVTITDQLYNCVEVLTFLLPNKSDALLSITNTTPVTCPRGSDGSVQFDLTTPPSVATPVTTTIKDGNGNTYSATALPAGDYCIEVTDATGCLIGGSCFEITQPEEIFLEISRIPATCSKGGLIIAKAAGGNDNFTFDWVDVDGTDDGPTRGNLEPGTYAVLATDSKGCSVYVNNIPIAEPKEPTASLSSTSPATLLSNDGTISVVTEGGLEPFRYLWSNGNGNMPNNPNLSPGPYSVTVIDANGCVNILETVLEADCTFDIKPTNNIVGCAGNDGGIDLMITGGTGTISYIWSNGATTASINNLVPGEYSVTVTDQGACRYEETFTIGENCDCENVMIEEVKVNQLAECGVADGAAEVIVANPNADITYSWSDGVVKDSPTRDDLEAGDYTVTVTDNISGCTKMESVSIGNQPTTAKVIINPLVNCFNDTGVLIFNIERSACFEGPMDVVIVDSNGTEFPFDQLPAGEFELVVIDGNGVEIQREAFSVTSLPEIGIDFDITPSSCDGPGAIDLSVVGGNDQFSFDWQDQAGDANDPNRSNLAPGVYELFLKDNTTGCISESSYTVAAEGLDITSIDTIYTCDKDQVQLAVNNNKPEDQLSYEWTPSVGIIAGADTGTPTVSVEGEQVYTYTVQNQFGCEETGSVRVISAMTRPPASIDQALQCDGRTVDFKSSGGALGNYIWDFGDGTTSREINPSHVYAEAGNYTVGLRLDPVFPCADALGLMSERTLNVLEDAVTEASFEIDYDPCVDEGLITFRNTSEVSPGTPNWNWDFGNGMTSTEENPQITIEDNTNLNVTLTLSTTDGCESQFTQQEPFQIFRFPTVSDTVMACPNVATPVNPDGVADLKYSWSPAGVFDNSNIASPLITVDRTTLVEVVISQDMCETKSTVLVMVPEVVEYDKTEDVTVCSDDEVEIGANFEQEGTLIWSESPDFDPIISTAASFTAGPGEYFFQFTDEFGCTIEDGVSIENATPDSDIIADDPIPLCVGASTMLSVRNGNPTFEFISYQWLPDPSIQTENLSAPRIAIAPTETTDYTVIVMNIAGCEDTITTTVEVVNLETTIDLSASRDTIFNGEQVDLNVTPSVGVDVTWSDDPNAGPTRTVMPMSDTVYEVTVTDENGCTTTKMVMITVQNPICGPPNIFFPNAFSPNGDGINDVLRLRGNGLEEVFWVIQNRWGEEVFRANAQSDEWDGTFNGTLVDPDVYGYVLQVTCFSGEIYEEKGNVTVLR